MKKLQSLQTDDQSRISHAIKEMEVDPFAGDVVPIKGMRGVFRRRVGSYRIAFAVNFEKDEVVVLRIGQRSKFYEGL